jgi:glutaredoxin 3
MPVYELFGTVGCPYTQELRDWLDFKRRDFIEYDVEVDSGALQRMQALTNGQRTVPVLVEDGKVVQIGWQGRGCVVRASSA